MLLKRVCLSVHPCTELIGARSAHCAAMGLLCCCKDPQVVTPIADLSEAESGPSTSTSHPARSKQSIQHGPQPPGPSRSRPSNGFFSDKPVSRAASTRPEAAYIASESLESRELDRHLAESMRELDRALSMCHGQGGSPSLNASMTRGNASSRLRSLPPQPPP
jgi:hypothetical protein